MPVPSRHPPLNLPLANTIIGGHGGIGFGLVCLSSSELRVSKDAVYLQGDTAWALLSMRGLGLSSSKLCYRILYKPNPFTEALLRVLKLIGQDRA